MKTKIFAFRMIDIDDNLAKVLCEKFLCKQQINKMNAFYFKEDRRRALFTGMLVNHVIYKELGIGIDRLKFQYNRFGKPFIITPGKFEFNISHSAEWILCVIHSEKVGIDIEKIVDIEDSVIESCLEEREWEQWKQSCARERLRLFYRFWVLKEAFLKAIGCGLSYPIKSVSFDLSSGVALREKRNCCFKEIYVEQNYQAAVCLFGVCSTEDIEYKELSLENLLAEKMMDEILW